MLRTYHFLPLLLLLACGNPIKNEDPGVSVEPGTDTAVSVPSPAPAPAPGTTTIEAPEADDPVGNWVGYFEKDGDDYGKDVHPDEGFYWNRANKINLSIDAIRGDSVFGHSVVAGNDRPFVGTRKELYGKYRYQVSEPGDDRYDGTFDFTIEDGTLSGTWTAYKNIDIKHRVYDLEPRAFTYDPTVMLDEDRRFIDWTKSQKTTETYDEGDGEVYEWVSETFSSATNDIYQINASNERLTRAQVENLKKGDLTIIRNTIYARHGYSFKNRPLRVFFDAQSWYVPVHADIRADFTELEKENIQLLLQFEENAAEYYDYFGRG